MIPISQFSAMDISKVPAGHLFIANELGPRLGIRAEVSGESHSPFIGAVFLDEGKLPRVAWVPMQARVSCIDVGQRPEVRVPELLACVTNLSTARGPGRLAIAEGALCIIGNDSEGNELWLDLRTGSFVMPGSPCWYVTKWDLGLRDDQGEFHMLYHYGAEAAASSDTPK